MEAGATNSFGTGKGSNFVTEDLPFAIYLHASSRLLFLMCQVSGTGRIAFIFADSQNEGDQLQKSFEAGAELRFTTAFATCAASWTEHE
jgi:hypothetical protein